MFNKFFPKKRTQMATKHGAYIACLINQVTGARALAHAQAPGQQQRHALTHKSTTHIHTEIYINYCFSTKKFISWKHLKFKTYAHSVFFFVTKSKWNLKVTNFSTYYVTHTFSSAHVLTVRDVLCSGIIISKSCNETESLCLSEHRLFISMAVIHGS
jgi:hypothetical protein